MTWSRAQQYFNRHSALNLNDCFALTLAEEIEDAILMTGDGRLRSIAERNNMEVRGVPWATDELEESEVVSMRALHDALRLFQDDEFVYLPREEIAQRLRRLGRKL